METGFYRTPGSGVWRRMPVGSPWSTWASRNADRFVIGTVMVFTELNPKTLMTMVGIYVIRGSLYEHTAEERFCGGLDDLVFEYHDRPDLQDALVGNDLEDLVRETLADLLS